MRKFFLVFLLLAVFVGYGEASKQTTVQGIRYSSYKNHTRVVVDLNGPLQFTSYHISNPDRLYFDLKNCILSKKTTPFISINNGVLKSARIAQFNKETVRVALDLQQFGKFYTFTLEDPYRLVIDIYIQKGAAPLKKKGIVKKKFSRIKTVVIDPGHGGKDPGAIGPRGLKEKDVVLDVGKKLGKILKDKYRMNVTYTRKKDVFIPLNERTEIANSKKADLFISIHVNANRLRRLNGIETYILNWTNDKEAMRVAARENAISFKKMQKVQDELQMILQDLARDNKRDESVMLARSVQDSLISTLKKKHRRITDLGVKQALFYVLIGAEMPSILIEVSFISNREEEKRLSKNSYKNKIAEAIAKGVMSYIKQSTLIVKKASGNI